MSAFQRSGDRRDIGATNALRRKLYRVMVRREPVPVDLSIPHDAEGDLKGDGPDTYFWNARRQLTELGEQHGHRAVLL
jgi:hypothetical protein